MANAEVPMEVRKAMAAQSCDEVHERYSHLDVGVQKSAMAKLPSMLD
jgi:hypothetical protein